MHTLTVTFADPEKTKPNTTILWTNEAIVCCPCTIKFACAVYKDRYNNIAIRKMGYYTASLSPTTPPLYHESVV